VVFMPHTVAYPGTVMVHLHNACVANATMMGSWWPERYTVETVPPLNQADCALRELFVNSIFYLTPLAFRHAYDIKL
jgi:hypothetical protein